MGTDELSSATADYFMFSCDPEALPDRQQGHENVTWLEKIHSWNSTCSQ